MLDSPDHNLHETSTNGAEHACDLLRVLAFVLMVF